jgi:hypothetical protein
MATKAERKGLKHSEKGMIMKTITIKTKQLKILCLINRVFDYSWFKLRNNERLK